MISVGIDVSKEKSMICIFKPNEDEAVYQFILKKEMEGKPKKVAKIVGLNKLLRIYCARVMEF